MKTASESKTYTVIGYNDKNCSDSSSISIEVRDTPEQPGITRLEDPLIKLVSSSQFGNQWFLDENPIEGANGVEYYPNEIGSYAVQVTLDECTSPFSDKVEVSQIILFTEDISHETLFWPNPTNGPLKWNAPLNTYTDYMILDQAGKIVQLGALRDNLDVSTLVKGVYILKLFDKEAHYLQYKFVKK